MERWRKCHLSYHKELSILSVVQTNIQKNTDSALTVCFPLSACKVYYQGFEVAANGESQSRSNKKWQMSFGDKDMESLVVTIRVAGTGTYCIQLPNAKQAEQVINLFVGGLIKDQETVMDATSSVRKSADVSSKTNTAKRTSSYSKSKEEKSSLKGDDESQSAADQEASKHHESSHVRSGAEVGATSKASAKTEDSTEA
jgi:hypothetical protein